MLIRVHWADIAKLLGLTVGTAKQYGTGGGRKFDPRDLQSVFAYWLSRQS